MASFNYYKCCMVPMCSNTSIKTPNKIFISAPRDVKRKKWLIAAKRNVNSVGIQSRLYCCEDHFDLSNDMENWIEYSMMKCRIRMKKDAVPHKFDCQLDQKEASTSALVMDVAVKRPRQEEKQNTSSDKATKTNLSEEIQTTKAQQYSSHETTVPPLKNIFVDAVPSPIKASSDENSSTVSIASVSSPVAYATESSDSQETDTSSDFEKEELKQLSIRRTTLVIQRYPRLYLGVPKDCYFIINLLSEATNIPVINILLCLKKIKLNTTFLELSHDFGMSVSNSRSIFTESIPRIARHLKSFIVWKNIRKSIINNLPVPFRFRYNRVHSIIDCLEIEIQDYKRTNTLKYLVSCTPDGVVNFISKGYCDGITDALLMEQCGYLDQLHAGTEIMANRGFMHVEQLLASKNCKLIRPPSVSSSIQLTEQQVSESKSIASIRIHVEKLITRIREFTYFASHACIDKHLVPYTDHIIVIVAALINLQGRRSVNKSE